MNCFASVMYATRTGEKARQPFGEAEERSDNALRMDSESEAASPIAAEAPE